MKFLLSLWISFMVVVTCCYAQIPEPLWTRSIGAENDEEAYAVCRLTSGDILVGGRTNLNGQSGTDPILVRLSMTGDSLWSAVPGQISNWDSVSVNGLFALADGGFVAAGSGGSFSQGPFLTRFNAAGDTTWNVRYSGWSNLKTKSAALIADRGYVLVGDITAQWNDTLRPFAARLGSGGGMRWSRTYALDSWGRANAVVATPDSGFAVAGCLGSLVNDTTIARAYLMRLNTRCDTIWTRTYGSANRRSEFRSVDRTSDGGFILAGFSNAFGNDDYDIWVVRTDSMGTLLWEHHFGTRQEDIANSVKATDGGYVIAGRSYVSAAQDYDGYLMWLNPEGGVAWSGHVGGSGYDDFNQLVVSPDGGFVVCGTSYSTELGTANMSVMRFPPGSGWVGTVRDRVTHAGLPNVAVAVAGQNRIAWTDAQGFYQLYVTPGIYDLITYGACTTRDTVRSDTVVQSFVDTLNWIVDRPHADIPQSSLNLVVHNHVGGSTPLLIRNEGPGLLDFSLTATTNSPHGAWLNTQPEAGSIPAGDSVVVSVTVHADTTDNSIFDYYGGITIHVNSCPDTSQWISVVATVLDVGDDPASVVRSFSLSAYPNPFNPSTTLNYSLPQRETVSLMLYDITGRQVRLLRQGVAEAGTYQLSVDGSDLPSGIYFVSLQTPTRHQTQKLMLLK